jgi:hypothetical protein
VPFPFLKVYITILLYFLIFFHFREVTVRPPYRKDLPDLAQAALVKAKEPVSFSSFPSTDFTVDE